MVEKPRDPHEARLRHAERDGRARVHGPRGRPLRGLQLPHLRHRDFRRLSDLCTNQSISRVDGVEAMIYAL